jgi:hypothetical protein
VSLPGFFVCNYGQFEKKIKAIDSRRTDHFEDQSAVLKSDKDPLATSEDSTFRI